MKTEKELKKDSLTFALGIALGAIGGWLLARGKEKREGAIRKDRPYISEEDESRQITEDDSSEDEYAITPIIWGTGPEFDEFVKKNKNRFNKPEPYTRKDVINFVARYVKRVINVKVKNHQPTRPAAGNTEVNKTKEPLVIYLPYETIKILLKGIPQAEQDEGGLMAMFAIDTTSNSNKNQTFVLMPYGADKRAIVSDNNAYGTERWDTGSKKLSQIVSNDEDGNIELDVLAAHIESYLVSDIEKPKVEPFI